MKIRLRTRPSSDTAGPGAPSGDLNRRSVHGATVTFVAQILRFVVSFATQALLAHLILPAEFGLIAMVAPIISLVLMLGQMGLLEATIQRQEISQAELSALFWVNMLASVVLAAVLAASAPLVARLYGEPATVPITVSLSFLVILNGVAAQQMALLNRGMRFGRLAVIEVAATLLSALTGLALAWDGFGVWSLVAMQAANSGVTALLAWIMCGWVPGRPRRQRGLSGLLRFGGDVTGFNVMDYLAYSLDNVLIGATNSAASLGLYDRAFKLAFQPLLLAMTPFTRVAVPLLSRQQDAPGRYARSYVRLLQSTSLAIVPGLLVAIVLSNEIVILLLGRPWAKAGPILAWLAVASLATPLLISTSWLFISQNRAREQLRWGSLGAATRILAFVVGLPWGPLGVAVAGAIANCLVQAPLLCWAATATGPIRRRRLLREGYPFVVAALATAIALRLIQNSALWHGVGYGFPGLIAMGVLSYAVYTFVLACLPQGYRVLREIWQLRAAFRRRAA
ncbi:MAG: lipopolysaccharide biosynthesis protein [Rhodospirillales bacterium]|jgi:PST family polysaccharide transporter|nr:lipopolysaccharide biosynthesis protein [Rhodospirillales bacterium]